MQIIGCAPYEQLRLTHSVEKIRGEAGDRRGRDARFDAFNRAAVEPHGRERRFDHVELLREHGADHAGEDVAPCPPWRAWPNPSD